MKRPAGWLKLDAAISDNKTIKIGGVLRLIKFTWEMAEALEQLTYGECERTPCSVFGCTEGKQVLKEFKAWK